MTIPTQAPEVFFEGPEEEHRRKLALIIRELLEGKSNNVEEITLAELEMTTEVLRKRVTINTTVLLTPKTASAAAAMGGGSVWVETTLGKAIIHHDSSPDTDRTFAAAFIG